MAHLKGLLLYVGIGLACFVFFTGLTRFDANDLMFYAWVLGWPILLLFKIGFWLLCFFGVMLLITLVIAWRES